MALYTPIKRRCGFTLVELSVVLVIIGLLVAGVLAAQDMIRAAQVRRVIKDVDGYKTSVMLFRDKYGGLPGDITNATDFWSGTANGDGDKKLTWNTEGYRAWQQLALSGMIPGSYTGTATGNQGEIGVNVPASSIDGGGFSFSYHRTPYRKEFILLGSETTNTYPYSGLLSVQEAWGVDKKIDDGLAVSGEVIGETGSGAGPCTTGTLAVDQVYDLDATGNNCIVGFSFQARP